jgi:hypothetical protein
MIDLLWWLDAPFWQQLYAVGLIGGISWFISEMYDTLENWDVKLKGFIHDCRENYVNDLKRWRH